MMGPPVLLALSLGLSVTIAAMAWIGGRLVERATADPRLRGKVWATALILPALPPLMVCLLLLTPAPVREIPMAPASLTTTFITTPAEVVSAAPLPAFSLDPTLTAWAILGFAALLAVVRLTALALRTRRLVRLIRDAQAPGPAVTALVESAARELGIPAPRVGVSAATSEALLASLGRARLILPVGLTDGADAVPASAVIAHELAHLKRGDHRTLWLEEALLALLAFNPMMPLLHARRSAAREEACDALALVEAAPETRRLYAQSLINALRSRAGPQALPALTFTGARRTQAMSRLNAVMTPPAAAGLRARLMALGLGGLIAVLAGAGSLAVAGEREAVTLFGSAPPTIGSEPRALRMGQPNTAAATVRLEKQSRTVDPGAGSFALLNGKPLPEGLPIWAVAPERIDVRTPPAGSGGINLILPFTGRVPVSVNGHRMPSGFPANGVNYDAVARVEVEGPHVLYTLKSEMEARLAIRNAGLPPQMTQERPLSDEGARPRSMSAADYKAACASSEPRDDGHCAGAMFNVLARSAQVGFCPPPAVASPGATGSDLHAFVDRGRREIARMSPAPDEGALGLAERALKLAYPCDGAAAPGDAARVTPTAAVNVARIEPGEDVQNGRTAGPTVTPARPRESKFLTARRAEREAARQAWPNESGLRLPGWPRPDRPAGRSPFAYERRAADPQNLGVSRP